MIETLNSIITRAKKSQRLVPRSEPVKVNIGSYLLVEKGWINVEGTIHALLAGKSEVLAKLMYRHSNARDVVATEDDYLQILRNNTFVHHDLAYGLPFPDSSVDFAYASHILEHFYPRAARDLLLEAHRVLKSRGVVRICVPDLQHVLDLYVSGRKERALDYFFQDEQTAGFHRHKYMYDFDLLKALLETVGFERVERCKFRQGSVPDIEKLDNRPEETLFVEAMKP